VFVGDLPEDRVPLAEDEVNAVADAKEVVVIVAVLFGVVVVLCDRLGLPDPVRETRGVALIVALTDALRVWAPVLETVAVVKGLLEAGTVPVIVRVWGGVADSFGAFVGVVELVDDLDALTDLVVVCELRRGVPVLAAEPVVVRLWLTLLVEEADAVVLREAVVDLVVDEEDVCDFDGGALRVAHRVGGAECVLSPVLENDGDAEGVLDGAIVLERVAEPEEVLEGAAERLREGVAEDVLELLEEGLTVLVLSGVPVSAVEAVVVLEGGIDREMPAELDAVFEEVMLRVDVDDFIGVQVGKGVGVGNHVGLTLFVAVVVFVDVLDCV
jgi:hypothetical protein